MQTQALFDYSYHPVYGTTQTSPVCSPVMELNLTKAFVRDTDFLIDSLDDEIFRDLERALTEQKVSLRENHLALLLPPQMGYAHISDTDSSSSAEADSSFCDWLQTLDEGLGPVRRIRKTYEGDLSITAPGEPLSQAEPVQRLKRTAPIDPTRKRKRTKTVTKKARALYSSAADMVGANAALGLKINGQPGESPRHNSNATTRAEFESLVNSLSTPLLLCVISELAGVREGKERVYCSATSRPPDHALRDPLDGRAYLYRKVIPHQHKPEKSGDPSPRCFACAARMMHEKTMAVARSREQNIPESEYNSAENIEAARRAIIAALGLPLKTRVFEYETTANPLDLKQVKQ